MGKKLPMRLVHHANSSAATRGRQTPTRRTDTVRGAVISFDAFRGVRGWNMIIVIRATPGLSYFLRCIIIMASCTRSGTFGTDEKLCFSLIRDRRPPINQTGEIWAVLVESNLCFAQRPRTFVSRWQYVLVNFLWIYVLSLRKRSLMLIHW